MAIKDVSVVLAHGAWADGSSWARVITALKAEAVNVSAAPLPLTSRAEDDRMIVPETQRYMAERMKAKIKPHAVDQTLSVTAPRAVVDIIGDAIRSITGN